MAASQDDKPKSASLPMSTSAPPASSSMSHFQIALIAKLLFDGLETMLPK